MKALEGIAKRQTTADLVFEHLYEEIISLGLMPGTKMSESDIADRFGVSRQPVRDAFNRLGNLKLLQIQPQRATQVRKFSLQDIAAARYIRLAVELEIARTATDNWTETRREDFEENLRSQAVAMANLDHHAFLHLDNEFHQLIADVAQTPFAFELVQEKKTQVDRICVLSLKTPEGMVALIEDHRAIFGHIAAGDRHAVDSAMRAHLSRIESTISEIYRQHGEYFE